jgi:hypothetical protein
MVPWYIVGSTIQGHMVPWYIVGSTIQTLAAKIGHITREYTVL